MMKLIKTIGQPFCIILYIVSIIMAFRKKLIPLISLFSMHLTEFFIIGKKTGKENGLSTKSSLLHCLAFGFTWWLPLRKEK
ncbi:MAG: hypothetical protein MJ168_10195 [Clostridia bacterium]|nr:hypothetical protein [Clostridia bacterium]